ncbi:hypothetical protein ACFL1R_08340 [Candidatus Latescibacterota bacterium]
MNSSLYKTQILFFIILKTIVLIIGCSSSSPVGSDGDFIQFYSTVGYTYQQPDGNQVAFGYGDLPFIKPIDIQLSDVPQWIVAVPIYGGSIWVTVLNDGKVQAFKIEGNDVVPVDIYPDTLTPGTPPTVVVDINGIPKLLNVHDSEASPLTNPVILDISDGSFAYIENTGDLLIQKGSHISRVAVNALPDTRLLTDGSGRILLLSDPTDSYIHGVTGDTMEATSISIIDINSFPTIVKKIRIEEPHIIEGISAIWTDLTGDGIREIIITISDAKQGAQLVVYNEKGEQIATGPAIGKGYRWRHQIAAASFENNGIIEIVDVKTPHIGGIIEFYQLQQDSLKIEATLSGFTSHEYGSRNLDMAIVGDFDNDGLMELLLPSESFMEFGAIRRTYESAEVLWRIPVGGIITTNIASVTLPGSTIGLGVGHNGKILRLWLK